MKFGGRHALLIYGPKVLSQCCVLGPRTLFFRIIYPGPIYQTQVQCFVKQYAKIQVIAHATYIFLVMNPSYVPKVFAEILN